MFWDTILKYSFDSKFQQMISISPKHFKKFVYMIGVVTSFPTQTWITYFMKCYILVVFLILNTEVH